MREAAKSRPPEDQDELPRRSHAGPASAYRKMKWRKAMRQFNCIKGNL